MSLLRKGRKKEPIYTGGKMKREVNVLDAIAKYEDVNFPLWGYTDFKEEMDFDHRLRSIKRELHMVIDIIEHAENRIEKGIEKEKLNKCIEEAKG